MLAFGSRHASSGVRAGLPSFLLGLSLVAAASGGGCTLLVGSELSDKRSEGAGGAGGEGGGATTSTASHSSAAQSSSATGGLVCKADTANCNGFLGDGCEAKLLSDPKNCGVCKHTCDAGKHCKEGKCE
jgi:hypothetical protein